MGAPTRNSLIKDIADRAESMATGLSANYVEESVEFVLRVEGSTWKGIQSSNR